MLLVPNHRKVVGGRAEGYNTMTTTMTLECRSFTATPLEDGKMRLEITGALPKQKDSEAAYEAEAAAVRLSELLGRKVSRGNLAYWRENLNLPFRKLGMKKFVYREVDLVTWAKGQVAMV
jgi:hypothetical protein